MVVAAPCQPLVARPRLVLRGTGRSPAARMPTYTLGGHCAGVVLRPAATGSDMGAAAEAQAAASLGWPALTQFAGLLDAAPETVALGGHRGMGANVWHPTAAAALPPAPYRENTLKSFQRAVACGASFLEFDVQVTADGVPVIWHDNYVVYGDEAAPTSRLISDLTYAQFHALAPINYSSSAGMASGSAASANDLLLLGGSPLGGSPLGGSPLSGSPLGGSPLMGASPASSTASFGSMDTTYSAATTSTASSRRSRLLRKHRNGEPAVPHEPTLRSWECQEEDHFPSLAEVFANIPPSVAFDIEIKMATPDDLAVTPAAEVDRIVSATLAAVDAGLLAHGARLVLFSSFDPDVCLEVKRRRPDSPVMFLSGGGVYAHADPRRTSIAAAIDFAAGAGLEGIILNTLALQGEPQMVEAARACGLRIMTYGLLNDNPDWVRAQFGLGVQGVIVDDVAGVAAALSAEVALPAQ